MFSPGFKKRKTISSLIANVLVIGLFFCIPRSVDAQNIVSCAASAGTLGGAYITVNGDQAQVNVRSGPNSYQYGKVGFLLTYESAPAIGYSTGGDWIQVSCPGAPGGTGWVYSANVTLTAQIELPIIELPATSTPIITSTVDPALAAEFPSVQPTFTRPPTFTPVVPQTPPTFIDVPVSLVSINIPGGLIIGIVIVGVIILFVSYLLKS